jgi:serine/threonine protein kinase
MLVYCQGHYGEVIKGKYTDESGHVQDVAIKRLKKTMTEKYANEFEKEFRIMVRLEHSNIVRIIGRCHDSSKIFLLIMGLLEIVIIYCIA